MKEKLAGEILDALNNTGASIKKKEDTHINGRSKQGLCSL
jgi:ribosomal protein S7